MGFLYLISDNDNFSESDFLKKYLNSLFYLPLGEVVFRIVPTFLSYITVNEWWMELFKTLSGQGSNEIMTPASVVGFLAGVSYSALFDKRESIKNRNDDFYGFIVLMFIFNVGNCLLWNVMLSAKLSTGFVLALAIPVYAFISLYFHKKNIS